MWRWIWLGLLPASAYGCALVAGIGPPLPAHCTDGIKNMGEDEVDCGGTCAACDGQECSGDADCAHLSCGSDFRCALPTCPSDPNCAVCHDCKPGIACIFDTDCTHGLCQDGLCATCSTDGDCHGTRCLVGTCVEVTCKNGVKDGDETGVDCGGTCGETLGLFCPDTCADGKLSPGETDVDCGGITCPLCADGKKCKAADDCEDYVCGTDGTCSAPTCMDHTLNQDETDVDCGGPTCVARCDTGSMCNVPGDCKSGICDTSVSPAVCG